MTALFEHQPVVTLDLEDADIELHEGFDCGFDSTILRHRLVQNTKWREESITLFGKSYLQPRLFAWYGDQNAQYCYSGLTLQPAPWTSELSALRDRLSAHCSTAFNSVLLNYYRDHRDSMGMHADDEPELGSSPVIASLSLGETRDISFKHKHRKDVKTCRVPLKDSSLLVMRGQTQRHWKHGISKLSRPCGPRVNLTFRKILPG